MDFQLIFNLSLSAVIFGSIVKNTMDLSGLVKNQYASNDAHTVHVLLGSIPLVVGSLIFIFLLMFEGDQILEKATFLFGR